LSCASSGHINKLKQYIGPFDIYASESDFAQQSVTKFTAIIGMKLPKPNTVAKLELWFRGRFVEHVSRTQAPQQSVTKLIALIGI
jgi:hypothetical protein